MAGPWEKYQSVEEIGPWSKFQESSVSIESTEPPKRSYRATEVPLEAVKNTPKSAVNLIRNVAQAVLHPIDTLGALANVAGGAVNMLMPQGLPVGHYSMAPIAAWLNNQSPEQKKKMVNVAKAAGGAIADRYGSWDNIKRTVAEDPVGAAADLSAILGGVGAVGKLNTLKTASKFTNPASILDVPYVGPNRLVNKTANFLYNRLDPKSAMYMKTAEGKAPEILQDLNNPQVFVPGSMPTAAQAAVGSSGTLFQALGKSSADILPTNYLNKLDEQKTAQVANLKKVAKTKEDVKKAENVRSAAASELYGLADEAIVPGDTELNILLKRPSMKKVINRAADLAKESDQPFKIGQDRPAKTVNSKILDADGKPITKQLKEEVAKYPGSSLHYIKMALDDIINDPATFGIGASEAKKISNTRSEFLQWVEKKVPAYKEARETYAAQSAPIDQMEVGQYLLNKLVPALGEDSANLRSGMYATALENAPLTLKKSTGVPRYKELDEVLTPDQLKIVNSVKKDLGRQARSENMAKAASKSKNHLIDIGEGIQLPNMLNRTATIANTIINKLKHGINRELAIEIATEMLDPAKASKSIRKAIEREVKGKKLAAPFKGTASVLMNPATPGILNALSAQSPNDNVLSR